MKPAPSFAAALVFVPAVLSSQITTTTTIGGTVSGMDLIPRTLQVAATSAKPGETIALTLPVRNGGGTTIKGGWSARIFLSSDASVTASDISVGTYSYSSGITGGLQGTTTGTLTVPATTRPGQYYVSVLVDATNIVAESNEANNFAVPVAITVVPVVDLIPAAVTGIPAQFTAPATVSLTVRNAGVATSAAGVQGTLYLSADGDITAADSAIGSFVTPAEIAPGMTSSPIQVSIRVPSPIKEGSYRIGVIVDPKNSLVEISESNNVLDAGGTSIPAKLIVTTVSTLPIAASGAKGGDVFDASVSIKNDGVAWSPALTVPVYLSNDTDFSPDDPSIGTLLIPTVSSTSSATIKASLRIPAGKSPGAYYIGTRDGPKIQTPIKIVPPPDIVVRSVSMGSQAMGLQQVSATVSNIGAGTAHGGWRLRWILTRDNSNDFASSSSSSLVDQIIDADSTKQIPGTLAMPVLAPGLYSIIVSMEDQARLYEEGSGSANASVPLPVPARVSLKVESLGLVNDNNGVPAASDVRISNVGDHDTSGDGWSSSWALEVLYAGDSITAASGSTKNDQTGFLYVERVPISLKARSAVQQQTPLYSQAAAGTMYWVSARVVNTAAENTVITATPGLGYALSYRR